MGKTKRYRGLVVTTPYDVSCCYKPHKSWQSALAHALTRAFSFEEVAVIELDEKNRAILKGGEYVFSKRMLAHDARELLSKDHDNHE